MSREIRFRMWDKACNVMILPDDPKSFNLYFNGSCSIEDCGWVTSDTELQQFTGLQDKNGKDIYEGDLLRFLHDYKDYPVKQVIWNNNHLGYSLLSKQEEEWVEAGSNHFKYWHTDVDNLYFLQEIESYEIEVIGNIHENPELF